MSHDRKSHVNPTSQGDLNNRRLVDDLTKRRASWQSEAAPPSGQQSPTKSLPLNSDRLKITEEEFEHSSKAAGQHPSIFSIPNALSLSRSLDTQADAHRWHNSHVQWFSDQKVVSNRKNTHTSQASLHKYWNIIRSLHEIPKCPRNDEDIILDEVAENLALKACRLSFKETIFLQDNSRLNLEVLINRASLHFDCTFSRDVEPAKYLQYTCRSQILEAKVHIEQQVRK
ncbi:hypothetical protein SprV_0501856900 [Sparganum proliferum]